MNEVLKMFITADDAIIESCQKVSGAYTLHQYLGGGVGPPMETRDLVVVDDSSN